MHGRSRRKALRQRCRLRETGSQRWSLRRLPVRLPARSPRGTPGGAVVPLLLLLLAEGCAVNSLIERLNRNGKAVCAVGFLGKRNGRPPRQRQPPRRCPCRRTDKPVPPMCILAVISPFLTVSSHAVTLNNVGAGIDGYIVGAVLHFVAGDRRHAVLNNVLDIGHIGRRSDLRGGAAVLRGGVLLGAAAAGGQGA